MSSLLQYDIAVYQKMKALYDETFFAAPEEVMKVNAKSHKGKVIMPFIAVWRLPDFTINKSMYNDSYVRRGPAARTKGTNTEFPNAKVNMHGVPVSMQYQVDVYATKRDVCDGLMAEIVLEMLENPWVNVKQSDMGDFIQQFNIDIDDSITDNTSISEFEDTNRFYRLTATLEMQEAVIYRISDITKDINKVEVSIDFDSSLEDLIKNTSNLIEADD